MKRSELIFSAVLVPLDYLSLIAAASVAYYLRYLPSVQEIRPVVFQLEFIDFLRTVLIFALIWIAVFALAGLYFIRTPKNLFEEIGKIFLACSTGIAIVTSVMFFTRYLFDSRFILLASWGLSIVFVSLERMIVRYIQRYLYIRKIGVHRVVLVGNGQAAENLIKMIGRENRSGYLVVGEYPEYNEQVKNILEEGAQKDEYDEIIQTNPDMPRQQILDLAELAHDHHREFKYVADVLGSKPVHFGVSMIFDIPIAEIRRTPLDGWGRIFKRIFDIIFSLIFIILFSPIMLLAAVLIKLDSEGPILFRYKRVGEKGKLMHFIKFRTMIKDAHKLRYDKNFLQRHENTRAGTPMIKFANDPRITRVGKFLRRWSIDEMPQFFLVLAGKMSLVGPRPHEPEEVAQYTRIQRRVLSVKPGITGLAQISGRSDLDFHEEIRLDTFYIENWSLKLDIIILLKTPLAVIRKRKTL